MTRIVNSLGIAQQVGPRGTTSGIGYAVYDTGFSRVLVYDYDFDNLPSASKDDSGVPTIPANSYIVQGFHQVVDAFTVGSTDTVQFGLDQPDGTNINVNGLDAAVDLDAASVGDWTTFDGALIGASVGANDAQVTVSGVSDSANITAGRGVIVVEYIPDYSASR